MSYKIAENSAIITRPGVISDYLFTAPAQKTKAFYFRSKPRRFGRHCIGRFLTEFLIIDTLQKWVIAKLCLQTQMLPGFHASLIVAK